MKYIQNLSLLMALTSLYSVTAMSYERSFYRCGPYQITITEYDGNIHYQSISTKGDLSLSDGTSRTLYGGESTEYTFRNGRYVYQVTTYYGGADLVVRKGRRVLMQRDCVAVSPEEEAEE